jgi:hypothetical protein
MVEVASPRTRLFDRNRKKDVYEVSASPAYWIIEDRANVTCHGTLSSSGVACAECRGSVVISTHPACEYPIGYPQIYAPPALSGVVRLILLPSVQDRKANDEHDVGGAPLDRCSHDRPARAVRSQPGRLSPVEGTCRGAGTAAPSIRNYAAEWVRSNTPTSERRAPRQHDHKALVTT